MIETYKIIRGMYDDDVCPEMRKDTNIKGTKVHSPFPTLWLMISCMPNVDPYKMAGVLVSSYLSLNRLPTNLCF